MDKVRLAVEELQVQSFATTDEAPAPRGTVRAHDARTDQVECATQNPDWDTCWATCNGSCACSDSCRCETAECSVDDCWFSIWECTFGYGASYC